LVRAVEKTPALLGCRNCACIMTVAMAGFYSRVRDGGVCGELPPREMIMLERRFGVRFPVIGIDL